MIPDQSDPPLKRLLAIMARLRDPKHGCDWDQAQTFATIAPYTIEEAYEVADAVDRGDMLALQDELGDLLLQVVFHARMAEEAGAFDFGSVAAGIAAKMERRHPHIFADQFEPDQPREQSWETLKADERTARGVTGALDGIALALPALMRAEKLQKRAARQGFDWPDVAGPAAKVAEEAEELAEAVTYQQRMEEAGDFLFAAANLVRAYGVPPEESLRQANVKFERRFHAMEALASKQGLRFEHLNPAEQDDLWRAVKASEPGKAP